MAEISHHNDEAFVWWLNSAISLFRGNNELTTKLGRNNKNIKALINAPKYFAAIIIVFSPLNNEISIIIGTLGTRFEH